MGCISLALAIGVSCFPLFDRSAVGTAANFPTPSTQHGNRKHPLDIVIFHNDPTLRLLRLAQSIVGLCYV